MFKRINHNCLFGRSAETRNDDIAERFIGLLLVGISVTVLSGLTACGGGGSSPAASAGSTTCTDIAGEPDIMGQITYTSSSPTAGSTVIMHIPVDGETAFVGAELTGISGGAIVGNTTPTLTSGTGYVAVTTPGAQTVDVPMVIASGSGAGSYVPVVNLCTVDLNTCKKVGGAGGVAVNYAYQSATITSSPLLRFKYFASGATITPSLGNLGTNSCVNAAVLTVN